MKIITNAIVLRRLKLSDTDVLVSIFSDKYGKITCVAKGGRNPKSALNSASHLFVYGEFEVSLGSKWNYLNGVEIYDSFYKLREDLELLSYSSYIAEFTEYVVAEDVANIRLFRLFKTVLGLLSQGYDVEVLKVIYILKAFEYIGYKPITNSCIECNAHQNLYFMSIEKGGVVCNKCALNLHNCLKIGKKLSKLMTLILNEDIIKLLELDINEYYIQKLDVLLEKYFKQHVGVKKFKSMEILKNIKF